MKQQHQTDPRDYICVKCTTWFYSKSSYGAESSLPARGDLLYRVIAVGTNVFLYLSLWQLQQSVGEGAPLTVQLQVERMGGRDAYRWLLYDTDTTERYRYSTDTYRDTFMLHKGSILSSHNYSHEALYYIVNMSNEYYIQLWDLDLLVLNKQVIYEENWFCDII